MKNPSSTNCSSTNWIWSRVLLLTLLLNYAHAFVHQNSCPTIAQLSVHQHPPFRRVHHIIGRNAVALVDDTSYNPYDVANNIEPKTKPLMQSMAFYALFVVEHFAKIRQNKVRERIKGRRRAMWRTLNEQRKNIMSLAGYTSHIVAPSFLFLFLGALMTSVVPSYYSKCIHCVSTLSATRSQLSEAILGLGISSILAALFTGLRGSLFWIGGECSWSLRTFME
jgi:hypothetical protein